MRRRNLWAFVKGLLFTQLFIILIVLGVSFDLTKGVAERIGALDFNPNWLGIAELNINEKLAEGMLRENNVVLGGSGENQRPWRNYLSNQLPAELLVFNMRALATSDSDIDIYDLNTSSPETVELSDNLDSQQLNTEGDYSSLFQGYLVTLYCTHSGESYVPDSGAARVEGGPGLINEVAVHLGKSLKDKGLQTNYINTLHDYPDFQKSYTNSRKTVAHVLAAKGQKILALFDIHRDSVPGVTEGRRVNINGKQAAPILIVVGTDERKSHPHWKENLAFAQKLYKEGAKLYPGLIKEVRTKSGTYNQEFYKNSLLLEFGTDYNTLEECMYSGELFADILLKVLKEDI